jgi:O-antigen ligase
MAKSKQELIKRVNKYQIYLWLLLFPLGQLIRVDLQLLGEPITVHPIDLVAITTLPYLALKAFSKNKVVIAIMNFLIICVFSLILSLNYFTPNQVLVGSFYLLRLISYLSLFLASLYWINTRENGRNKLFDTLIIVSLTSAMIGWFQYFLYPDLRILRVLGWDDHLFRMVGSFLDPTFLSIILIFGIFTSFYKYLHTKRIGIGLVSLILLVSLAFTYTRAAYLALAISAVLVTLKSKYLKYVLVIVPAIALSFVLLLPRPSSEGVKLERLHTFSHKLDNYSQTFQVIKKHPLFGVGFNNMCPARLKYVGDLGYISHSCSGSDSSLLLVTATTGIVGLMVFLYGLAVIYRNLESSVYTKAFKASFFALLIHSLFVNSLFYPWVMGYMALLLSASIKKI